MAETVDSDSATGSERRVESTDGITGGGLLEAERTRRRIGFSVGTFVVTGVGFVFTLFFVSRFGGNAGSFGGNLFSGISVALAFGLALVFSPLVAVVLGSKIGHDGAGRPVVEAGTGAAVGFIVMFFATLVTASALGSTGDASGAVGAGPLLGFTVGVGLTGAGSAAVANADQSLFASITDHEFRRPLVYGVGTFVAYAVGFTVAIFLAASLAQTDGAIGIGMRLGNVTAVLVIGLLLSPIIGLHVGLFAGRDGEGDSTRAAATGGVASAAGVVAMLVVLYAVVLVVEPEGVAAGQFPLGPLLGFAVGTGLTGAGAGAVSA